jgi:hypothetical protein
MKNAAAISAQLVDVRNVGQHKCVKLTLHVPAEQAGLVMAAFGWPTMVDPVPVAIAHLDPNKIGAGPPREGQTAPADPPASRPPVAVEKRLTMRAAILSNDPMFHRYLSTTQGESCLSSDDAANYIRTLCQVQSRKDILPGTKAAFRLDLLESAFIGWRDADKYIEAAE